MKLINVYRVLAAIILSSFLVGCEAPEEKAEKFMENGIRLVAEGETSKAALEFKNALQINPTDAAPYYQLALIAEKNKNWIAMFNNLSATVQLKPDHYEATVKLGQLYLLAGNLDEAKNLANKASELDSSNVSGYLLNTNIAMKNNEYSKAADFLEKAYALDPENIKVLTAKALMQRNQGQGQQALTTINDALKLEDILPVKMIKLSILEALKDYDGMLDILRPLQKDNPTEKWIIVSIVRILNGQGKYEEAKAEIVAFTKANPNMIESKLMLVEFIQTKEPEEALALLDGFIQEGGDSKFKFQITKVQLLLGLGKNDDAKETLNNILKVEQGIKDELAVKNMLAAIAYSDGDIPSAKDYINQVLNIEPVDEKALLLKAQFAVQEKRYEDALTSLRTVIRNNPESELAYVLLAQTYLNTGSDELADDSFRNALNINPGNTLAALSVASTLVKTNDLNRTEEVLINALKLKPNDKPLLQALAQIRILKKDWLGSEAVISELKVDNKETAISRYLTGRILQEQGDFSAAIDEYKESLLLNPNMIRALQGLAKSYIDLGDKVSLLDYMTKFLDTNPKVFNGYSVLASIHIQDKNWQKAYDAINAGLATSTKWERGYIVLSSIYLAQNNKKEAFNTYDRGLNEVPNSISIRLQRASLYEQTGDYQKANLDYKKILELNPDVEPAINNLASLYTDKFDSPDNLSKALTLSERFQDSTEPYFLDTYAWVNVKLGNLEEALPILERVVNLSPDTAIFNYHLAYLYQKQKKMVLALKYKKKAMKLADEMGDSELKKLIEKIEISQRYIIE